jgi:hypothetical protein
LWFRQRKFHSVPLQSLIKPLSPPNRKLYLIPISRRDASGRTAACRFGFDKVAACWVLAQLNCPDDRPSESSQVASLRMLNKWYVFNEGQAGNRNNNAAACLCFLNYLAFLRPIADRAVSILPSVVSRGRSYELLWADL